MTRQPAALSAHLQIPEWGTRCRAGRWQHLRFAFSKNECKGGRYSSPPTCSQPSPAMFGSAGLWGLFGATRPQSKHDWHLFGAASLSITHTCVNCPGTLFSGFPLAQGASRGKSPCPPCVGVVTGQRGPFLKDPFVSTSSSGQAVPKLLVAVRKQCDRLWSCPATWSVSCKILEQALRREMPSIAEPNTFTPACKPRASCQALVWRVAPLTPHLSRFGV